MGTKRMKWKYRDPSWPQIVWAYGLGLILTLVDPSPNRVLLGLAFMALVTVFTAIKLVRERKGKPQQDTR